MKFCEGCKHYSGNDKEGFCRRYPPQVAGPNYSQFPGVKPEWNCGEWADQPVKAKKAK